MNIPQMVLSKFEPIPKYSKYIGIENSNGISNIFNLFMVFIRYYLNLYLKIVFIALKILQKN
jgi:hypothetical protein